MLARDKHFSLLRTFVNYGRKKFYNLVASSSPAASSFHAGTSMVPGPGGASSLPVITSFAMKGDSVSPGIYVTLKK